ncbi:MAG TPA: tetratricopeptide repeat protein [Steroidobacteraceae bacterium]|nr:tetratricopeptide repeat protein [Steroidobacteraceae bacterium]
MQTVAQAMHEAGVLYARGRRAEAEQRCRAILQSRADHFEALSLLGVIAAQTERKQEAAELLRRAAALRPRDVTAASNYSKVLTELQRFDEALQSYGRLLELKPDYAEGHNSRGVVLQRLGRTAEALASYERALQHKPDYPQAHYNRGVALRALNRPHEALGSYERALALRPQDADAQNNRGVILQELGRTEEALASYERALAIKPHDLETHLNRGHALQSLDRLDDALESYQRAAAIQPGCAEAHACRGDVLRKLGRLQDALRAYDRALELRPDYAEAHNNRGIVLQGLQRAEDALQSYRRAIAVAAGNAGYHHNLGNALVRLRRREEAVDSYARALALEPHRPWLRGDWLHARMQLCDWRGIEAHRRVLLDEVTESKRSIQPFHALALTDSPVLQRHLASLWLSDRYPGQSALPAIDARPRGDKIRLGYYSSDLRSHPVTYLAIALFEQHDRARFEVTAFSLGARQHDELGHRLTAAFDRFLEVGEKSDREIAQLSRQLRIDIAVDLNGFTEHARSGIFRQRAAPIQVNYLGYPGTLSAPFIDYIVADPILIPAQSRTHYAEKVACLPHSYQPNDRKRAISETIPAREELGLPARGVVFCCFNGAYKITPETFDSWMRILRDVAGSVLWLLPDTAAMAANLRMEAEARGIEGARLVFGSRMALSSEHLARHRAADLFLDTHPYGAHTTASDALWAGLPVLTRRGDSFAARVAASLLSAVGLPELITTTPQEYEALAIELANDRDRLAQLTERLRRARESAPLFDSELYARHLEEAYTQMYERYLRGESPDHLSVG